jgi:hypothetical protein
MSEDAMVRKFLRRSSSPQKRFGPGRSVLRKAADDRGRRVSNLWYHYSPRLRHDIVCESDAAFAHFCWLEGHRKVAHYEVRPAPLEVVVGHGVQLLKVSAVVQVRDGPPELHFLPEHQEDTKAETLTAAEQAGFKCVAIDHAFIAEHDQLIRNWRCATCFQAACRDVNLQPFMSDCLRAARRKMRSTVEELLNGTNPAAEPIYYAALFACLQSGALDSDLDVKPLCAASEIWETSHA